MVTKQLENVRLEQSSNYWKLRIAKHEKYPEKWVMSMEKDVLIKRMASIRQNMGLPLLIEKIVHEIEPYFQAQPSVEKIILTGTKRTHHY